MPPRSIWPGRSQVRRDKDSKGKPVVELLRVSTSMQAGDDRAGLPRQMEANRRTVERHGLVVVRTVRLVDVSGTATIHAPEVQDMLAMLKTGQAQGIVCAPHGCG